MNTRGYSVFKTVCIVFIVASLFLGFWMTNMLRPSDAENVQFNLKFSLFFWTVGLISAVLLFYTTKKHQKKLNDTANADDGIKGMYFNAVHNNTLNTFENLSYEDVKSSYVANKTLIADDNMWICKKCSTKNSRLSAFCKDCGHYR